jgi:predicted transcriptional regulator
MLVNKEQLRAARAWLGLSQQELATIAKVHKRTIANIEGGETSPHEVTLQAVVQALMAMGIEFQFEGSVGVGVRATRNVSDYRPNGDVKL